MKYTRRNQRGGFLPGFLLSAAGKRARKEKKETRKKARKKALAKRQKLAVYLNKTLKAEGFDAYAEPVLHFWIDPAPQFGLQAVIAHRRMSELFGTVLKKLEKMEKKFEDIEKKIDDSCKT